MYMDWTFNYIAITNDIREAKIIETCGIQQIMVDLEFIGKAERQFNTNAVLNKHKPSDVSNLKNSGINSKILCRINGNHKDIFKEIDEVIESDADAIMIPMINNIEIYKKTIEFINGRVEVIPLIETPYSIFKIDEIIRLTNPKQIHFGLNDLSLALGTKNIFELFLSPIFSNVLDFAKNKVDLMGIGGIGNPMEYQKIDPELILQLHKINGSKSVILSRSFFKMGYDINKIQTSLNLFNKIIELPNNNFDHNKFRQQVEKFN